MTTEAPIAAPLNQFVKVLYDYEYTDEVDKNKVHMEVGEVFHLLNTQSSEWWQVSRLDEPDNPFYVPSTYVEVLNSGNDNLHDGDNTTLQTGHNGSDLSKIVGWNTELNTANNNVKMNNQIDSDEQDSDYMNLRTYKMPEGSDFTVQYVQNQKRPSDDIGDYANLDELRKAANIPQPEHQHNTSPQLEQENDYANLEELRLNEPSQPDVENCEFKRTLTDSTMDTWDQFLDPNTNRLFYIHNKTKEIQWKPPRGGQYHSELMKKKHRLSSGEYEEPFFPPRSRKSRSLDFGKPSLALETSVPEGWSYGITDAGESVFTDTKTNQKRSGGSSPTKSPTSDPEDQFASISNQQTKASDKPRRTQVSDRFNKSRSVMIENLHFTAPPHSIGQQGPKSATLPPNFTSAIPEVPVEELGSRRGSGPDSHQSQPFSQTVNINEPIEGVLNKCVLVNGKKSAKKWAYSFVKLSGSNLLLYKDQKISQKSQPQIVALVTCTVEKDPKSFTSKKNTICVTNAEYHILLQAEDDAKSQEWFLKLHTKIREMGGTPDPAQPEGSSLVPNNPENLPGRKPSFKGKHSRTNSDGGSLEKKGKVQSILKTLISNRSDKEKLVKKGIYKDAVFGSEIKQLCEKEKSKVPNFVLQSIEAIEKRGLNHEGLYRIGGNVSQIQKLRCMVDQGEKYDLDDQMWDVNVLSGCLKLFFRELKEPLFTYTLFERFLKSYLKEVATERLKAIKATINELPKCNYETVKVLFKHLTNVIDHHSENKMQAHPLAIVFGPTLIWPEVQSKNLATSMVYQSRIVEFILLEYKNIFR